LKIFGYEPAAILYGVNAAVALLVAYGLDLTQDQVSAVSVLATAILSIVVAVMTRPIVVSSITAAAATALSAVAAFGLELSAEQISTAVTAGSIVLALALRANVSPAPVGAPKA
jgi:uncharacterized membrane protein